MSDSCLCKKLARNARLVSYSLNPPCFSILPFPSLSPCICHCAAPSFTCTCTVHVKWWWLLYISARGLSPSQRGCMYVEHTVHPHASTCTDSDESTIVSQLEPQPPPQRYKCRENTRERTHVNSNAGARKSLHFEIYTTRGPVVSGRCWDGFRFWARKFASSILRGG